MFKFHAFRQNSGRLQPQQPLPPISFKPPRADQTWVFFLGGILCRLTRKNDTETKINQERHDNEPTNNWSNLPLTNKHSVLMNFCSKKQRRCFEQKSSPNQQTGVYYHLTVDHPHNNLRTDPPAPGPQRPLYRYIHYITLHCITLHYITLHYTTLRYVTTHTFRYLYIYTYM